MPRPALRSRTTKRKLVRTPGGRLVIHIIDKKHDYPKCAICKRPLHGFPRMTAREERRGHRPPTRAYGGYLCSECLRRGLKAAIDALYFSGQD
ncbi:MAG: 50S ribosomal protein L34e [Thermoprotei archaeon]|nr:MAG: 50S ribosomal protein L34e [Thermoprotei archaeon]